MLYAAHHLDGRAMDTYIDIHYIFLLYLTHASPMFDKRGVRQQMQSNIKSTTDLVEASDQSWDINAAQSQMLHIHTCILPAYINSEVGCVM